MDVTTMAVLIGVVNVLLVVVLLVQYRLNRHRGFAGLGWWALGQAAVAAGLVVSAARTSGGLGRLAIPLYQGLLALGAVLILAGLLMFIGRGVRIAWLVTVVVALVAWSAFFTFVDDRIAWRSVALYLVIAGVDLIAAWVLARHAPVAFRSTARATGVVFAAGAAVYLTLAIVWASLGSAEGTVATPAPVSATANLASLSATVLWTFGLVAMVNQRLSVEIVVDARNMHTVFATSPDCSVISRLDDGKIDDVNAGFTRLTGFERTEAVGRTSVELGLWADGGLREQYVRAVVEKGSVSDFPMVLRRRDASTVECLVAGSTLTLEGEPYLISVVRDVTQQRRWEAELVHEATTDGLTGLPNRREFLAQCARELHRVERSGGSLAVAILDIDHFKEINDSHGHATGDETLTAFSRDVSSIIRDIDTCGRLGGDEFAVLLPDAALDDAVAALERIRRQVEETPCVAGGHQLRITISVGVAEARPGDDTVDALLVRADRALYDAKESGRNRVVAERPGWRP